MNTEPLVAIQDLTVSGPSGEILHGLNLDVAPGERVGLIGESGSGKSMTCLSVMGLLPGTLHASGSIHLAGEPSNLLEMSDKQLAHLRGQRMSMVFQEPMTALNPLMQVGAQVAEIMRIGHRAPRGADLGERAVELLASVGIPDPARAAKAYPHQLSGGQRQRVMLAMAMANTPDLLLADEPTTALDVTVQHQVLELMRHQVTEAGTSLLFITHDLAIVAEICERVVILRDGRIVEEGSLDRVFTAPRDPYTKALLAASALEVNPDTNRLVTLVDLAPTAGTAASGEPETPVRSGGAHATQDASAKASASFIPPHEVLPDGHEASWAFNRAPSMAAAEPAVVVATEVVRTYVRPGRGMRPPQRVHALRNVSFEVRQGQHFGIVGESGCGKSTLLRILTGLDQATSGSVRVEGREITGQPERRLDWLRRTVQIVFQDPMGSLDPRMRIEDVVAEPLIGVGREERRARVVELLEQVGLPRGAVDRYPHEFSGGQRQRIAIARALVSQPRILVADEAVSALDVSVRAQVLNLLADLVDAYGLTLVFVSHDLHVVRYVCDTVAVMNQGQIVECGPTEAVYDNPLHPYTRTLIEAVPTLELAS